MLYELTPRSNPLALYEIESSPASSVRLLRGGDPGSDPENLGLLAPLAMTSC